MPGTHDLGLFLLATLVLNATPGVDLLLTLTRTLHGGARAGIAAALGINAGCLVHTVAGAVGLAAVLAASAWAFSLVKWAGAAYLLWLAIGMLRSAWAAPTSAPAAAELTAPRAASWGRIFVQGFLTNVLNPKVAIFFLALLPQFISADAPSKPLAFIFLGGVFILCGMATLFVVVAMAHVARRIGTGARARRVLNGIGGGLFALLAARLALAERT